MLNTKLPNVLEKIVIDKKTAIESLKQKLPLESFIDDLVPTTKSLYQTLSNDNAGFVLECKKASPSKGLIREDFDVIEIANTYDKYAAGISVLTEEKYFQGNFEYLKTVSNRVKCPVLNKDFIFDAYQVYLARYYGADAILLMLSVLNDEEYLALAKIAEKYNMAILTEISNIEERQRAIDLNAKLIGINNRNLRDLSTDIATTLELAPGIPSDRIVISESGIYTNAQVRELAPAVDGFLVGSSIMAEKNIDRACRKLIYGQHKVCGLTRIEDAQAAASAGAIYGGLIFAEKSPRCITLAQAQNLSDTVDELEYFGVFVNQPVALVAEYANSLKLNTIQLHGDEDAEYINQLTSQIDYPVNIFKALAVREEIPPLSLPVEGYLLDSKSPGSGQVFNWQLLLESEHDLSHAMLAGGISEENIRPAITVLTAQDLMGLDINSGVEITPGLKDHNKLNRVFSFIRNY